MPDATATPAGGRHGRPWRAAGAAVVLLLFAMLGAGMIGASFRTAPAPRPPQPLAQAGPDVTAPGGATGGVGDPFELTPNAAAGLPEAALSDADQPGTGSAWDVSAEADRSAASLAAPSGMARATPTVISIPRIGVHAPIMTLGTNPDGTVEVPPLSQARNAGWYSPGPSPGEIGNAVIVGHVDSAKIGPAVFFELGALLPGDAVTVSRADGRQVSFTVNTVKAYPKDAFPSELVYGPSNRAGLRVVTCGGQFDRRSGSYAENVIVFATMTD